jgi:hypothetical protein
MLICRSPAAYQLDRANAIPIRGWYSDPNDRALLDLLPLLEALRGVHDVRSVLGRASTATATATANATATATATANANANANATAGRHAAAGITAGGGAR